MTVVTITIEKELAGERIDKALATIQEGDSIFA